MQAGVPTGAQVQCEVCEAVQPPASVCASCGMPLRLPAGVRPIADPPIEQVPDLEMTVLDRVGDIRVDIDPELEPTSLGPAPEIAGELPPGFERVEFEEDDLPGFEEEMPDMEPTSVPFQKTIPPSEGYPKLCPYCGFEQASGRICNNCGRSRIRVLKSAAPAARAWREGDEPTVRCRGCGATVKAAALCSDCGQPLPPVEFES